MSPAERELELFPARAEALIRLSRAIAAYAGLGEDAGLLERTNARKEIKDSALALAFLFSDDDEAMA